MRNHIYIFTLLSFFACKTETEKIESRAKSKVNVSENFSYEEELNKRKENTTKDSVLSNDIQFINDSILKGKFKLDISKYSDESSKNKCYPIRLNKNIFNEFYNEGFEYIGDLNGDGKEDYVFVLPALNYCEEGDSYYFTNNNIPRILTDSNCCHPNNIINIGDIDEDGNMEIAEYYSSCASRYKAITIYSLKNSKWNEIKSFSFVLNDKYSIEKDFKKLFRKTSKNQLEYYEINDVDIKNELVASWKKIKI